MAIRQYDPETNTYKIMTNAQIKKSIMRRLGLDPENSEDQKTYRRQYDILRKRVKNYETATASTEPIKVNELFLRTLQRKQSGKELTAQQQNILNSPAVNTGTYLRRLEANTDLKRQIGISNLEREFKGFLEKYPNGRKQYEVWRDSIAAVKYFDPITGEVLTANQIKGKTKNKDYLIQTFTNLESATVEEVKNKLSQLAAELHNEQEKLYKAYKSNKNNYIKFRSELYL